MDTSAMFTASNDARICYRTCLAVSVSERPGPSVF